MLMLINVFVCSCVHIINSIGISKFIHKLAVGNGQLAKRSWQWAMGSWQFVLLLLTCCINCQLPFANCQLLFLINLRNYVLYGIYEITTANLLSSAERRSQAFFEIFKITFSLAWLSESVPMILTNTLTPFFTFFTCMIVPTGAVR